MSKTEIGAPPVKEKRIEIEGADGSIDYTDFFGEPKYGEAEHKFIFATIVPRSDFYTQYSNVKNALHGKKLRIVLDDDPAFYYVGRCHVSKFTDEKGGGRIEISCTCDPYKYKTAETVVTQAVSGTQQISLLNGRKRAVPTVTITAESTLNITYQVYNVWDLGSGSYRLPDLELVAGENIVTVTGTGTVSFAWQEAVL